MDPCSGVIVCSASVPPQPINALIDEHTGHALLLSLGGIESLPDPWSWVPRWLRRALPFLPRPGARTRVVPGSISLLDTDR